MLHRPSLKGQFTFEQLDANTLFIIYETGHRLLKGRLYGLVLPLLDGSHTTEEVVDILQEQAQPAEVYYTIMLLEQKGFLAEPPQQPREIEAFWYSLGQDPGKARAIMDRTTFSIQGLNGISTAFLQQSMESLGLKIEDSGNVGIVLTEDFLSPELADINQLFLEAKRPWFLLKLHGQTAWLGPYFSSEEGCWECLAHRIRTHRPIELFIQKKQQKELPITASFSSLPTTIATCLHMAVTEILKTLVSQKGYLRGKLLTFNSLKPELSAHYFTKRPQCSTCGDPQYWSRACAEPIIINTSSEIYGSQGLRSQTPENTWKNNARHVSPITGIVSHIKPIEMAQTGNIYNFNAGPNLAIRNQNLDLFQNHFRGVSLGKGMTESQARVSGLCEAIERYSGVYQGYEPCLVKSLKDLAEKAIHPNRCMLFSEEQYHKRSQSNPKAHSNFFKVPEPFDPTAEIAWTPLWSLSHQHIRYLPMQYCYYSYPRTTEPGFCIPDSNGCASGNTAEEALLHALLELIERDAVAIWWYNRLPKKGVDLSSFSNPWIQSMQETHDKLDRELWALNLTTDLQVPVYIALSRKKKGTEDIVMGFGAHLSEEAALSRAITEVNQTLPGAQLDAAGKYQDKNAAACHWFQNATVANNPYLGPHGNHFQQNNSSPHQGKKQSPLLELIDKLKEKGLECLALNQTRPDIGMPVYRVVVPGLRPFWKRLAPGRLYDIPVSMGLLASPVKEHELNPIPIFL